MAPVEPNKAGVIDEVRSAPTGTMWVFVADEDKLFNATRLLDIPELRHASQ